MSVTPTNTDLEAIPERSAPESVPSNGTHSEPDGRDALEALLAFSALHQQIRDCRAREEQDELRREDSHQLEQFVLDEVLQLVAERAVALTGADGVAIALAEGDAIICRASAGKVAPDHGMRIDPNSGFSGACLLSGQIVRCDDAETDPRVNPLVCRNLGARSIVAVPLAAKQTVIGLVEAFASEAYGFNDSDVRSLTLLAELILAALKPEEEDRLAEVSQRVISETVAAPSAAEAANLEDVSNRETPQPATEQLEGGLDSWLPEKPQTSRPGLGIVVALVLFAGILGAGLWWRMSRSTAAAVAVRPSPAVQVNATATEPPAAITPVASRPAPAEDRDMRKPVSVAKLATLPEVTGIRHWSSADSSTVVIDLEDQVQYEAHRLTDPERIYFDLPDTRLVPELFGKNLEIGDPLIQRVRVAQPVAGVTRVVLETKGASNFSVSLEVNPYRLVVEIRKIGSKPEAKSNIDLFSPAQHATTANVQAHPLAPRLRVVLDAGHGGWDLGTVGRAGLLEKDLALDIVGRLGKLVEDGLGAEVIYTRKDDSYVALERRTEIANLSEADLFLSVHANYSDYPSARGVETYYTNTYSSVKARPENDPAEPGLQNVNWTNVDIREKVRDSHLLATSIQHTLYATLAKKNPGLPNRGVKEAQYVVLTGTIMPAVLAEISFVSSPTDENNLQSATYREQIAEALYQGIARYAAEFHRVNLAKDEKQIGR